MPKKSKRHRLQSKKKGQDTGRLWAQIIPVLIAQDRHMWSIADELRRPT